MILHRIHPSLHLNNRGVAEKFRKVFQIHSGGGDRHFQVRPPGQEIFQIPQKEVDIEAALMGFVNNDGIIFA